MFAVTRFEIRKLAGQKRSWAGFVVVAMINGLFALAFHIRNMRDPAENVRGLEDRLVGEFMNAYSYTRTILAPCMFMLFPMVLAIIGAHVLAGEMETGSIRLELCRCVSRGQVMAGKFAALSIYAALLLLTLGVTSYAVSATMFKPAGDVLIPGPMFGLKHSIHVLTAGEAPVRLVLSYLLSVPMLMSVAAMTLMFATMTGHFTSAAIITTTVYFCSYVVGGIPMLSAVHPFLPTRYLPFWRYVLTPAVDWGTIATHAFWTTCYTAGFLGLAIAIFDRRDL